MKHKHKQRTPTHDQYLNYERKKRVLMETARTPEEIQRGLKRIAKEENL